MKIRVLTALLSGIILLTPGNAPASADPPSSGTLVTSSPEDETQKLRFWIKKKKAADGTEERPFHQFDIVTRGNLLLLTDKIDEALAKVERGEYHLALQQMQVEVLRRTDGCARDGAPDPDDLIADCAAQQEIYPLVMETIAMIEALK